MIDTLIVIYFVGLAIYTLLQLVVGNFGGVARFTIKRTGRTFYIPSMYGAAVLCLLWFIVLPVQIHQYQMERVRFHRARAKRRAEEKPGAPWITLGSEAEGL